MAQILKLPVRASKPGYKRARKSAACADSNQLDLFPHPGALILEFASPNLSVFEQALLSDERGDERAAELYRRAIEQNECAPDAYCNLGIIETQRGNIIKALDCFTQCLKENPRHTEAHYNLANLYFDQNDFRLAQLHFELAAQLDPSFANAFFNLALVQAINHQSLNAERTLAQYQQLVSADEGRMAEELLESLTKSLAAAKPNRFGTA